MSIPVDPIDFISKEKFITLTVIGSIFTYSMITKFRENVFDPLLVYVLPPESFDFMKFELPDDGPSPNIMSTNLDGTYENTDSYTINFGPWVRETFVWLFMILILYLMRVFLNWQTTSGGNSTGAAVM
jgi:large-conductance mechanosensitive channel